nr:C2 calcium-dependent domain-containing protein 4A-like [Meriones unguiculatus]
MWCLERLLRDRDGFLPGRARRAKARSSSACANVLTPDRIPEFCIPPRLEPSTAWAALRDAWAANADTHDGAGHTDWDPRSQAALSLPHLPRARTAYGFCALLECPHTRRKESLFLGHPGAPVPRPGLRQRAHTLASSRRVPDAPSSAPDNPDTARVLTPLAASRRRRLLRGPDGLLSRALRAPRGRAGARPASRGDEHERAASCAPPAPSGPDPERLQAEASVAVGRGAGKGRQDPGGVWVVRCGARGVRDSARARESVSALAEPRPGDGGAWVAEEERLLAARVRALEQRAEAVGGARAGQVRQRERSL